MITRDTKWRTRDGQLVRIRDMEDSHLMNTIRVLLDLSPKGTRFTTSRNRRMMWLLAMGEEAVARGLLIKRRRQLVGSERLLTAGELSTLEGIVLRKETQ